MKHLIPLIITFFAANAGAESTLKGVDLRLCNSAQQCLRITAQNGEGGSLGNLYVLRNVKVSGLDFDNKDISSAVVDLGSGHLIIREKKNGRLAGEWYINMNDFTKQFSEVP